MHELSVTKSILDIVLKHAKRHKVGRIISITLTVGELSELEDEWLQHYFDYLSRETEAEGAKLQIERKPIVLKCNFCGHIKSISKEELGGTKCAECGSLDEFSLVSGREYYVKEMEASNG